MPNNMPGSARYVRTNMAVPTSPFGGSATWKGNSMVQHTVVPTIPGLCFEARGSGVFPLSRVGRFPRGPRISGRRGTFDLWITTGAIGSERVVAFLTDNPSSPYNFIAIKLDASNRPLLEIQQVVTPLYAATGTLTAVGAITNTETVDIDGKTYTVVNSLTDTDGYVLQGATVGETLDNLVAAINLEAGAGSVYAASTTLHPTVTAVRGAGDTMVVTAKILGTGGNSITTTEVTVNASWGGATLAGGAGSTVTLADVTPSYSTNVAGKPIHVRVTWDSDNPVEGTRHASLKVNGESVPDIDWSTDPTAPWSPFQPQYLVLVGNTPGGTAFNGVVRSAQLSEEITP